MTQLDSVYRFEFTFSEKRVKRTDANVEVPLDTRVTVFVQRCRYPTGLNSDQVTSNAVNY
jgi:hypothetical protein